MSRQRRRGRDRIWQDGACSWTRTAGSFLRPPRSFDLCECPRRTRRGGGGDTRGRLRRGWFLLQLPGPELRPLRLCRDRFRSRPRGGSGPFFANSSWNGDRPGSGPEPFRGRATGGCRGRGPRRGILQGVEGALQPRIVFKEEYQRRISSSPAAVQKRQPRPRGGGDGGGAGDSLHRGGNAVHGGRRVGSACPHPRHSPPFACASRSLRLPCFGLTFLSRAYLARGPVCPSIRAPPNMLSAPTPLPLPAGPLAPLILPVRKFTSRIGACARAGRASAPPCASRARCASRCASRARSNGA